MEFNYDLKNVLIIIIIIHSSLYFRYLLFLKLAFQKESRSYIMLINKYQIIK